MAVAYTAYLVPVLIVFLRMTAPRVRRPERERTSAL
jgi:hypothetical protein